MASHLTIQKRFLEDKPTLKLLLILLACVIGGTSIGLASIYAPPVAYLLALGQAGLLATWWFLRLPQWTTVLFWVAFCIQSTILAGTIIPGLYYPIYLLMIANLFLAVVSKKVPIHWPILTSYILLYLLFILSLFNVDAYLPINFDLIQTFFIYAMGFLVYFQFRSESALRDFSRAQLWSGFIVSIWVLVTSFQGGLGNRGAIDGVDENYATALIVLGLIPLITRQLMPIRKQTLLLRIGSLLFIGFGLYALLILASRGITIAFVMAMLVIFARVSGDIRRSLPLVIVAVVAGVVLTTLPGSENLVDRFTGSDVASANGRTPLWAAGIRALQTAQPSELLLGGGFGYSRIVTSSVVGFLFSIHNAYLQIMLEVGIIGFILFMLLHIIPFRVAWKHKTQLSLHALGTIVFMLFTNLTLTFQEGFFYWVVMGHCFAIAAHLSTQPPQQVNEETPETSPAISAS